MCGIVGSYFDSSEYSNISFNSVLESIKHRGPDNQDYHFDNDKGVFLGHTRLSIIDLTENANQPMSSSDGRYWITFNGEVYNYSEIKEILVKKGYKFKSNCDTEVVLYSYIEWEEKCLEKFIGMFAFCIWDNYENKFFICRDRVGIKPLYYYYHKNTFIFASEIKAILKFNNINLELDQSAIYDYLTYLFIPRPKTLYKYVKKLEPGHYFIFNGNNASEPKQYWNLNPYNKTIFNENEAIEKVESLIIDSIKYRLISDVPVGILLSGGLDSSSLVAYATSFYPQKMNTFTIGFNEASQDETHYAKIIAEKYNTSHTTQTLDLDLFEELFWDLQKRYDEPLCDSALVPQYLSFKLASSKQKVILSGDGGDEIFYGYTWFEKIKQAEKFAKTRYMIPSSIKKKLIGFNSISRYARIKHFLIDDVFERFTYNKSGMTRMEKESVLNYDFLKTVGNDYDDYWYYKKYWKNDLDIKTRLQYLDFNTFLPDDILLKSDKVSMFNSVEARIPLLDHRLIELVFSIAPEIRNKSGLKYLFRKILSKKLPETIISKKKQGFSSPLSHWLNSNTLSSNYNMKLSDYIKPNLTFENPVRIYQMQVLSQWI